MLKKIESKKINKIYVESQKERKKTRDTLRKDERKKDGKRYTKKR